MTSFIQGDECTGRRTRGGNYIIKIKTFMISRHDSGCLPDQGSRMTGDLMEPFFLFK
jgi:hypothetical protein